MASQIKIISTIPDTRAQAIKKRLLNLGYDIHSVKILDVYTVNKKLTTKQLSGISILLVNPVSQKVIESVLESFKYCIEIGFLPGVTDNVASTAKESIQEFIKEPFKNDESVYTSRQIFLSGTLSRIDTENIADGMANSLIQRVQIKSHSQYKKDKGMDIIVPTVVLKEKVKTDTIDLDVSDEELTAIGKLGIKNKDGSRRGPLALNLVYMQAVRNYFKKQKRKPTDIELESIAQTWSEHCKHTIFADPIDDLKKGLFKTYIKAATEKINSPLCASVFTDNSGGIFFDENYIVTHKAETHNSPSALDPFGGAITGICGVNRDALGFGLGAKPVINTYGFCFANPDDDKPLYKGKNKSQKMLSPRRILDGVIDGVNAGGNQSGIPAPQGFMYFNDRFKGKPLIFVGTVGLIPRKIRNKKSYVKKAMPGDYIVVIGGRVGLDGIHGATFSSEAMDSGSPATAVQIGDPITQKKLSDAIVKEARDQGLYTSITDNGAGGISCSVAEMAKESGGCKVDLEKVPLKYHGLAPWQIWISESQERMTLAVPKKNWEKCKKLMTNRGVEATVIGTFTDSGKCVVRYNNETIMNVEMQFLHNGLPSRMMYSEKPLKNSTSSSPKQEHDLTKTFVTLVGRPKICSFEFVSKQYDHEVQAGSILKPLQGKGRVNADTTVTRPLLSSDRGIALSQSLYPLYTEIDAYNMAACAIDTAIRNVVVAGTKLKNIAILDNFCWCSPDSPERLYQLKDAARGCYDYAVAYGTPFISGKDSMHNDFRGYNEVGKPVSISVPPTLLISSIGITENVKKSVSIDLKFEGDILYILGETNDEMGGSEYFEMKHCYDKITPFVNAKKNKKLYSAYIQCVEKELVVSGISVGLGGIAAALAKSSIAGQLGVRMSLRKLPGSFSHDYYALFSESQGRILVSVNPKNALAFEKIMTGCVYSKIGKVTGKDISIIGISGEEIIRTSVETLTKSYKKQFKDY